VVPNVHRAASPYKAEANNHRRELGRLRDSRFNSWFSKRARSLGLPPIIGVWHTSRIINRGARDRRSGLRPFPGV
jgi:hypothetical protein